MNKVTKQSEFSRTKYNEAKMGAYYTDTDHCEWISKILDFPNEEVCCLEPSIGNAEAILAVTGKNKEERKNIKIFGVELNGDAYVEVRQRKEVLVCLKADFLNDVIISQHAFSFVFMNPPYGRNADGERYEMMFLRKVIPYLTKEAVMVVVIPYYVASEDDFCRKWCRSFDTLHIYRFHEKEYQKYKQIVLIGRKREYESTEEDVKEQKMRLTEDRLQVLPTDYSGEKVSIPKSSEKNVGEFMNRIFDAEEAGKMIEKSPLQEMILEKIWVPPYIIDNLGRPPIIPSEGHMYLLAVSGAGQGLVGKEENKDMHLQRGTSKVMKKSEIVTDEDGSQKEVVTSYPQINFNLIEADGTIKTLQ